MLIGVHDLDISKEEILTPLLEQCEGLIKIFFSRQLKSPVIKEKLKDATNKCP